MRTVHIHKVSIKKAINGIIAIIHIPLLLVIYLIKPLIKIKFGYLSVGRVGHFGLDLAYEIAAKNNSKEVVFYYLQGSVSNEQLGTIAKRELNISFYYKYFVYAYMIIGLGEKIKLPNRHKGGSFNIDGIVNDSKHEILLLPEEDEIGKAYLQKYGWTKKEKFVCLNVRDAAFFDEEKGARHAYRNSDIDTYESAIKYLLSMGYWVIRMGKKVEKPLNISHSKLIDYGTLSDRSDLLDIWFCKNCDFFISTGTGIDSVAMMFKKQILFLNYTPILILLSWVDAITVPKRLFWGNGLELSLTEHLDNAYTDSIQFKDKGIVVVDLSSDEIKSAVSEMINHLNNVPLTNEEISNNNKFWEIMEAHNSYGKFHDVRDPRAMLGSSFLGNNKNFLS